MSQHLFEVFYLDSFKIKKKNDISKQKALHFVLSNVL